MAIYTLADEAKRKKAAGIPLNHGVAPIAVPGVVKASLDQFAPTSGKYVEAKPTGTSVGVSGNNNGPGIGGQGVGLGQPARTEPFRFSDGSLPSIGSPFNPNVSKAVAEPTIDTASADITKQVNDEIAAKIAAYNNLGSSFKLDYDNAVNANGQFLNEQIGKLKENQAIGTDQTINLNNRRGGFYSGGLDYQLGNQAKGYAEAQGNLQRDVGTRNSELQAKYGQATREIADNIQRLQASAPELIKQRISEAVAAKRKADQEDQKAAIEVAGVTGYYNGEPTADYQDQLFDQELDISKFNLDVTKQDYQVKKDAALNEIKQSEVLQQQFKTLVETSDKLGYIVPELAPLLGVKPYSSTLSAEKQIADSAYKAGMLGVAQTNAATTKQNADTSKQNADTSRMNANTSAKNADTSRMNATNSQNKTIQANLDKSKNKNYESEVYSNLSQLDSEEEAKAWLKLNAGDITKNLGSEGLNRIKTSLGALYSDAVDPAEQAEEQAKQDSALRKSATALAAKDPEWFKKNADKEAIIQEYVNLLKGE